MATKRMLYKPAQANAGKKRNRRPLAQGRLVTAPPQSLPCGPHLQQGEVNQSDSQVSFLSAYTNREDPNTTPRRVVPHATEHISPLPSPPVQSLELSDNDSNLGTAQATPKVDHAAGRGQSQAPGAQVPVHHHPHVVVLDASALSHEPDTADVHCVIGYERSPVTVICHSQSAHSNSLSADGGDTTWQVQVDQVPRACVTSSPAAVSPLSGAALDLDTRATAAAADNDIDTMVSRAFRPQRVGSGRKKGLAPVLPQPNFDESDEGGKSESRSSVVREKLTSAPVPSEAMSDSDTCSLFEYVPQIKNRSKIVNSTHKFPPRSDKKRKGERMVPSRYMQSAISKKQSSTSAASDKSIAARRGMSHGSSNNSSGPTLGSGGKKTPSRPRSARKCLPSSGPNSSQAPIVQGKTSTPTHDDFPVMASCDASAINPELSLLSVLDASHLKLGSGSGHFVGQSSPRKQMKKVDPRVQQQRLDFLYAHYLQWLFLDSKATVMLQQQEKEAMRQLNTLWEMMENKRQEKTELERDVARLRHLNLLDEQLETQQCGLEPVVRVLPTLGKDYSGLAAALDTTCHQIHACGVHIPQDEDLYLASLEEVLAESEQLLGSLGLMTKKQAPVITEFAGAVRAVEKAVDEECLELYRCGELLSAVQSLATHENSLRIQAMQAHK